MRNFNNQHVGSERMSFNKETGLYHTKNPFSTGSLTVYLNGIAQEAGKWCDYLIKGDNSIKLEPHLSWVKPSKNKITCSYTVKNRYNKLNRKQPIIMATTATRKVQKNIQKFHNMYRVKKSVNGTRIQKSFSKLSQAREFLKTLN